MASNPEALNGNAVNAPAKPYVVTKFTESGELFDDGLEQFPSANEALTRAKEKALANSSAYVVMEIMTVIKPQVQASVIYSRRG